MNSLKDKVIIVTGGCGLIGKEIVRELTKEKVIVINADISVETRMELGTFHLDLSDNSSIDLLVKTVLAEYGHIDGLVNSAYPHTKDWGDYFFEDEPFEHWKRNTELQLNSVFYICQQVLKIMKNQGGGSVVNFGSIYGMVGNNFTIYEGYNGTSPADYCAIKGGIINLTRYLASYFGKYNIRVNCISPGGIFDNQNQSFLERYNQIVPMKRMGNPDDIAPAVLFLLSEGAKYITGQNIAIDGGWTAI